MRQPEEELPELVRQSLIRADTDLEVTEQLASTGRFREIIAFHGQQAVEKHLKSLLVHYQVDFPKTHDIARLLDLVELVEAGVASATRDAERLTPFGVEIRYPGDSPEMLPGAETEVLRIWRNVKQLVEQSLRRYPEPT
jgi:HEPN domain-containing protein